jgi:arylsulfatase A-like enzyme
MPLTRRSFLAALAAPRRPPNIVLILADDLGYGDLGCYGHPTHRTPHLNRLAASGLRFTDFHSNGPMCSATRAALLTGRYQNRLGRAFEGALGDADYDRGLPLQTPTIATVLKGRGYATALYGKWHLGFHAPYLPTRYGFDEFRGIVHGDSDHHSHVDRSGRQGWWQNETPINETGYAADLVTEHGVAFIEKNRRRPFFLYLPHLSIHFPWQGPRDSGYRQPGKDYNDLSKLGALSSKDVAAQTKAMVEHLDQCVGRIVAALQRNGVLKDTLVLFTSDNGGYLQYEGGYHNISSNGPLRGQKTEVYEGGHRVPAIACWPGRIRPGVTDSTAATFDLLPTFAQLGGAKMDGMALDGVSLETVLFEGRPLAERPLYWRIRTHRAARRGEWKLVRIGDAAPQLFNLRRDIGESRDLASNEPALTRELSAGLAAWEAEVDGSSVLGSKKKSP